MLRPTTTERASAPPLRGPWQRRAGAIVASALIGGLLLGQPSSASHGAAGDLDQAFGVGGIVISDFGSYDVAFDVAIQADEKLVAAGFSQLAFALARYNPDGSLDQAFGSGGRVTTPFSGDDVASGLAVQADGKLVAAGQTEAGLIDFALARYNPDGSLDQDFGSGGKVTTDFGSDDFAVDVALQSDGKPVLAGYTGDSPDNDLALARYNQDGSLDQDFGSGGMVTTDFGGRESGGDLIIQADGKVVVVGASVVTSVDSNFLLVRYNPDGSLDQAFGAGGRVITDLGGSDEAQALSMQSDGKLVVAGYSSARFALARYNQDGSLDVSFGSGGKVITTFTDNGTVVSAFLSAVATQADGKLVAAGTSFGDGSSFALARYNQDGTLDEDFGFGGLVMSDLGGAANEARAMAVQGDGKLVLAGFRGIVRPEGLDSDFALARYLTDGSVALPPMDSDGDGVPDGKDVCPGTPAGKPVDAQGCFRDLSIQFDQSVTPGEVRNTRSVDVAVDVTNNGQTTETGDPLVMFLPAGPSVVEGPLATQGACALVTPRAVNCDFGAIGPGVVASVALKLQTPCVEADTEPLPIDANIEAQDLVPGNDVADTIFVRILVDTTFEPLCRAKLADRFRPIVFVATGEFCHNSLRRREESYEPTEVGTMLARGFSDDPRTQLRVDDFQRDRDRNPQWQSLDSVLLEGRPPSVADLPLHDGPENYIDIAGVSPRQRDACQQYAVQYTQRRPVTPVTYVTIRPISVSFPITCGTEKLRLDYWFFYYFNDWQNKHEGDWEHIQVLFDESSVANVVNEGRTPLFVAYSQHLSRTCRGWQSQELRKDGDRPKVYVATGSHANYFSPGRKQGPASYGVPDFAAGEPPSGRRVDPVPTLLPSECDEIPANSPLAWARFRGQWGQELDFDDRPNLPFGTWSGGVFPAHCT